MNDNDNDSSGPVLSAAAEAVKEMLQNATELSEVLAVVTAHLSALSPEDKDELVRDIFGDFRERKRLELLARDLAEGAPRDWSGEKIADGEYQLYALAEIIAAFSDKNGDFPLMAALKKHAGSLSDEDYRIPQKLAFAFQQAVGEVLGEEAEDTYLKPIAIELRNPFKTVTETKNNARKPDRKQAGLRRYLAGKK